MPFSLEGKTILVTGASSNIGRQIAIRCSEMGAHIVVVGRDENRLQGTYNDLHSSGNQKMVFDITHYDEYTSFVDIIPTLDGIVLSAALLDTTPVRHISEKKMSDVFNTNTYANILLVKQILKNKKLNPGGSVVFISSVAALKPYKGNALYSATKGAIDSFSRVLALELCSQKIRVNSLHPGIVKRYTGLREGVISVEEQQKEESRMPLGFGTPDDIAYAALYLLSDASRWVTGTDMIVDGGQSIM